MAVTVADFHLEGGIVPLSHRTVVAEEIATTEVARGARRHEVVEHFPEAVEVGMCLCLVLLQMHIKEAVDCTSEGG